MLGIASGSASAGAWYRYDADAVSDYVTFAAHVPAGTYQIQLRVKRGSDRAQVQLATSGAAGGPYYDKDGPKDLYTASFDYVTFTYTDQVTFPSTGEKYFRLTVSGKNAASSGYRLGLDKLTLMKQ